MQIKDLNKKDLRLLLESVKYKGSIVTGGECGVGCKFCYLQESKQMAWRVPLNIPFISKADFKKAVLTAKKYGRKGVSLGDGVDLISSEPFIHPYIYDYIEELENSDSIGNIGITTSGLYIKKEKYDFLAECKKVSWLISCSSLTEEGREEVVLTKKCGNLLDFISFLHNRKSDSLDSLQLVAYGLKYFIKDLEIIKNSFPDFMNRIYIRELAYNKYFSKETKAMIEHCRGEFKKVLRYCHRNKIKIRWDDNNFKEDFKLKNKFNCFSGKINNFVIEMNKAVARCLVNNFKSPLFCISESCFDMLTRIKEKIVLPNLKKGYLKIKNVTFGGTYRCYGLLTIDDFLYALKNIDLKKSGYDVLVINGIFLNNDKLDLMRQHIGKLEKASKLPLLIMN